MCNDKHLIRMAARIHRHLSSQSTSIHSNWHSAVNEVLNRLWSVEGHWQLSGEAARRGWHAAALAKDKDLLAEASRIESALSRLSFQKPPGLVLANPPALGTIVAELKQLQDEFETFKIDLQNGLVGVTTPSIELEEINLGPFSIELHINRLADHLGSECFKCIALEPNPAASRDDTVHPHVQDGHICAGDASMPIASALGQGRIADAFVLIRSVLQNYNSESPYIALEHWSGSRCEDCDYLADSDGMYFCDDCERDVCEDCFSSCDMCGDGSCRSCLETDNVSDNRCCSACRHTCSQCQRTVDSESFDEETKLCPGCLEQQQENNHESESDDHDTDTHIVPATAPGIPAAA
jgi:hypothetical protein